MMETIRRRLARLEAKKPDPMDIVDVHYATDQQLEAYIIASHIERQKPAGLPAIEYDRPLSDDFLASMAKTLNPVSAYDRQPRAIPADVPGH